MLLLSPLKFGKSLMTMIITLYPPIYCLPQLHDKVSLDDVMKAPVLVQGCVCAVSKLLTVKSGMQIILVKTPQCIYQDLLAGKYFILEVEG